MFCTSFLISTLTTNPAYGTSELSSTYAGSRPIDLYTSSSVPTIDVDKRLADFFQANLCLFDTLSSLSPKGTNTAQRL